MSSLDQPDSNGTYWRSLGELSGSPRFREFLEAEFPRELDPSGMSRRRWLQLMGASIALAGVAGCRWPREEILPLAVRPEGRVPGEAEYYATAMELGGAALGLLVTSRDGRPVKIEGNPVHPASRGATHVFAQAAILELYDPDRSRGLRQITGSDAPSREWAEFSAFVDKHLQPLRDKQGEGLAVLAESSSSPTLAAIKARFAQRLPKARWVEYEPLSDDYVRAGAIQALGAPYRTHFQLVDADVVLCVDCDLLCSHPNAVQYARDFAERRDPVSGNMNRLYAVESGYSVTGTAADHRVSLASSRIGGWLARLEAALAPRIAKEQPANGEVEDPVLSALASDLVAAAGRSVIAVGPGQPPAVHAAAHRMNQALGNVGKTVVYYAVPDPERPGHVAGLRDLVRDVNEKLVTTLVVLGGNPVYNAPADLKFAAAFAKVPQRIHLSLYFDETSRAATWHVPRAQFLESWDDVRAYDGTYTVLQPLIAPRYGGKTPSEFIATILGEDPADGQTLVQRTFRESFGEADFATKWQQTVHDGLVAGSQWPVQTPALVASQGTTMPDSPGLAEGKLEIVFREDPSAYDGRFANSGWLQETPRPLTHITWDNAAILHPATARKFQIEPDTLVRLKHRGRELEMPVYLLPGHARDTVTVTLGYGRKAAGKVAGDAALEVASVGADTYSLRHSESLYFDVGVEVSPTGKAYTLATTEEHHAIDSLGKAAREERGRELLREGTLAEYREDPEFARHRVHHPPLKSLWNEWSYEEGHRWGMAIDLSKCIGCNACVVACQAENNVPVVGRQLVLQGREMHWLRVDRYFWGDAEADSPPVSHQVVTCQQCENAPCEQVCPVAATVHSHEGLNDMVYNRCIGTRYCANNCPYKVRRFNYFYFHWDLEKPENEVKKMVYNPEVTIRSRGVMEKCTYCVQRIQAGKIVAKNERRPMVDGEVRSACQQACPTRAIEFGDLNDPDSRVAKSQAAERAYAMLAELNAKPRTNYLARIRNPHPSLDKTEHEHARHTG
jgi:molybdopterin-containing oxidoreductase family iron-sulfur binding subunit